MISLNCFGQEKLSLNVLNSPVSTFPGSHINIIFEVTRASRFVEAIEVSIRLPENWQILSKKEPQNIIGEEKIKYIYTIMTPKYSKAGDFQLYLVAQSPDGFRVEKRLKIEILKVRKIQISPIIIPDYVKEGDTLKVDYLVQNLGNSQDYVKIESIEGDIIGNRDSLLIKPNESVTITSKEIVKESDSNSWTIPIGVKVYLKDSLVPIQVINSIQVYSTKIKKNDTYLRFPIEVGAWYTNYMFGTKSISGIQFDIRGRGFLDFKRKHYLDFTAHGPNNINIPILGSYDILSCNYNYNNKTFVKTGDYILQFNNLMEFGRFGRGFRIDNEAHKLGFTAFFTQPRFYNNQKNTVGGSLILKPNLKFRLSVDYMLKYMTNKERFFWSNLIGLSSRFQGQKLTWENEIVGN